MDDKGCTGAPDLIIEIVSPETASKYMKVKFDLYEKNGVKEYWIIHPFEKTVMVFQLDGNSEYQKPKTYSEKDKVKVKLFKHLIIDLEPVF